MDIGIDLLANPNKIKKKTYQYEKKSEDFDLKEFIFDTISDELSIDFTKISKIDLQKIISMTLKISDEYKSVDISHLENLNKKEAIKKLPQVLTKNLKIKKIIEKKENIVEVKKLPKLELKKSL
jgi:hypothetical protein|tara:strand:+ start:49 stop:420 length:372 start_codon:yes stop_codon:yes gene_type:complete